MVFLDFEGFRNILERKDFLSYKPSMVFNEKVNNTNKLRLSLAATMFFSPLVKALVSKGHLELKDEDVKFIDGYVRLWYLNVVLLLTTLIGAGAMYFTNNAIFNWVYLISISLLIGILIIGSGCAVAKINILQSDGQLVHYQDTNVDKSDILISYLPFYNIYLWYKLHSFEHPYWRAKESILLRSLFVAVAFLSKSAAASSFILIVIIIRVASLMWGMDFLDKEFKKRLNKLFVKNPEEVWGYISWVLTFFVKKISGWSSEITVESAITEQKLAYQSFNSLKIPHTRIQYLLLFISLGIWFYSSDFTLYSWILYVPIALIVWRYVIMFGKWKKLPHLPLMKEIIDLGFWIFEKIHTKFKKN